MGPGGVSREGVTNRVKGGNDDPIPGNEGSLRIQAGIVQQAGSLFFCVFKPEVNQAGFFYSLPSGIQFEEDA